MATTISNYTSTIGEWGSTVAPDSDLNEFTFSSSPREQYEKERREIEKKRYIKEVERRNHERIMYGMMNEIEGVPYPYDEVYEAIHKPIPQYTRCGNCYHRLNVNVPNYYWGSKPVCRNCIDDLNKKADMEQEENIKNIKRKRMLHNLYFNRYRADRKL